MTDGTWTSALLGGALGAAYGLASYLTYRFALARGNRAFLALVFGGMTVRIFVAVAVLTLILIFAPIQKTAFISSFFALFAIGLVIEVVVLHRHQSSASQGA